MLSKKYSSDFLNKYNDGMSDLSSIIKQIFKIEKDSNVEVLKWEENEFISFLKSFNAVSPHSLNKYSIILRDFADFICEKEGLKKREYKLKTVSPDELVNVEKLLKITLSYQQYRHIKNQLSFEYDADECNIRDKVLFELAWCGLGTDEIRLLNESMISFSESEYGSDVVILHLHTDRVVRIEDFEIVDDIKKCLKEKFYIVKTKAGVYKKLNYKDSEYLIKPVSVGRMKKEGYLDSPSITLQNVFKTNDVTCPGIDINELSIEDIRRSKMVYLLLPENRDYFDDETIIGLFNLSSVYQLSWLKKLAELKEKQGDL